MSARRRTPWPATTVEFELTGRAHHVSVPAEVDLKVEVELGDVNELEIELTW